MNRRTCAFPITVRDCIAREMKHKEEVPREDPQWSMPVVGHTRATEDEGTCGQMRMKDVTYDAPYDNWPMVERS